MLPIVGTFGVPVAVLELARAASDRAALDAHFSSGNLAVWRSTWRASGIGERALTYFEVDAGEPI